MNYIERKNNEIHIASNKIKIVVSVRGIYISSFGETVHNLVIIFVKRDDTIYPCSIKDFTFDKERNLHFNGYVKEDHIVKLTIKTNDQYLHIEAESKDEIGIMWPAKGNIFFGEEWIQSEKLYTHSVSYKVQPHSEKIIDNPFVRDITVPSLHHVLSQDSAITVFSDTDVEFNLFHYNRKVQCNAIACQHLSLKFVSNYNMRNNLSWWYKTHDRRHLNIPVKKHMGRQLMQEILIHNWECAGSISNIQLGNLARKIQDVISDHNIDSCVIGSFAMMAHGIQCAVVDLDFIIPKSKDIEKISTLLKDLKGYNNKLMPSENSKWFNRSVRFTIDDIVVDFNVMDSFDWEKSFDIINGIKVIDIYNLLQMKLIGMFEMEQIHANYTNFKIKNSENIHSLLCHYQFPMYPFIRESLIQISYQRFIEIVGMLNNRIWSDVYISINYPLVANAFTGNNKLFVTIINPGDKCDARVTIGIKSEQVRWISLDCLEEVIFQPKMYNETIEIDIPGIITGGVLEIS